MKSIVKNLFLSIFLLVLLFVLTIPIAVSEEVISNNSNAITILNDIIESFRLPLEIKLKGSDYSNFMILQVHNPIMNDVNLFLKAKILVPKGVYIQDVNSSWLVKNENWTIYEGDIEVPPGETYNVLIQLENYSQEWGYIHFEGKYYPCNFKGICLEEKWNPISFGKEFNSYKEEKPEKTKTTVSTTEILLLIFFGLPIFLIFIYFPLSYIIFIFKGNKNDEEENIMDDKESWSIEV